MTERMSLHTIENGLETHTFGQAIVYYDQLDSTNEELKRLIKIKVPEGMLVVTDDQTAGKGRLNRLWYAPSGSSILASILFRPSFLAAAHVQHLTMISALAVVDAIEAKTGLQVALKWPNDVVYKAKKLAGILTELAFDGNKLEWAVVGMGLNVNYNFNSSVDLKLLPTMPPLKETAISLQMILGKPIQRTSLLQHYLLEVEKRYEALKAGTSPYAEWTQKLTTIGQAVTVSGNFGSLDGVAESVAPNGALQLRLADGRLETFLAADVTLRKFKN